MPSTEYAAAGLPPAEEVDVVVVGMGPGGESMAGELAAAGLSVVGVEARLVGGECPYYGCIPSKMMIRAANTLAEARRVPELAGTARVSPGFAAVARRIRSEATDNWDDTAAAERFAGKGGLLVRGTGRLSGPREVTVSPAPAAPGPKPPDTASQPGGERTFRARLAVVLNPGTNPAVPDVPGLVGTPYWTNREAVQASEAPDSLIVWGGGPIAVELAQSFARFGTKVTMVLRGSRLLSREEPEAAELLEAVLLDEGVEILRNRGVTAVSHAGGRFTVDLAAAGGSPGAPGGEAARLSAGQLLVATGRAQALAAVGLVEAGIAWDGHHAPAVDGHMQLADGLYLIGDAAGAGAFTHMSMYQGNIAAGHILSRAEIGGAGAGRDRGVAEGHAVPRVTFTDPEIGVVGMTESQARESGRAVRTGFTELGASTRGWIHGPGGGGFIKVVEDADAGILLGATSVGPMGGEVLSMLALAVHARIPVSTLQGMICAYPTFHRAVEAALADLH
ncbi:pyruvate/2-oxoglutarate dehydrogenase complex dihydrolipoamide dehydrogenase (E3) component [Arthrobacter stackebrandtii]|uniref:Pyruvate/2-oxoglutarate dehydrogenase complex dihydrolipoamide dehydrogenase (E3) component n=1 Tax=Arthrobacter stackebrandtii TaxID=272161 RepID=A0ABS4YUU7_9MICC|nr:FAD-dependent oxidoreductase [Arthrobacter stackebrandtii]MBP2412571.1 pyruvate/2-oxoglutarate dehydrogenase complex dihydrolipoamide dehydrogenase (E3) component [Arthrobacter stackebrandtii]PYH02313.1 pyridine nucleotide-disulfide oxidoreductase [Arthrobacter stackebrandtii]